MESLTADWLAFELRHLVQLGWRRQSRSRSQQIWVGGHLGISGFQTSPEVKQWNGHLVRLGPWRQVPDSAVEWANPWSCCRLPDSVGWERFRDLGHSHRWYMSNLGTFGSDRALVGLMLGCRLRWNALDVLTFQLGLDQSRHRVSGWRQQQTVYVSWEARPLYTDLVSKRSQAQQAPSWSCPPLEWLAQTVQLAGDSNFTWLHLPFLLIRHYYYGIE